MTITVFPNRFAGICHRCQTAIAAGAGHCFKQDGRWMVSCRTACEERPPVPRQQPPARPAQQVGDLAGILALFDRAKRHLKFPAIILSVPALGTESAVRLTIAGERAKVPGSITVTDGNRDDDGSRSWLGRILLDGSYKPSTEAINALAVPAIADRLRAFAADPARVAGEDGRLHGRCCFCRIRLTDERSTAVGYGEKCAAHFGLAWGDRPAEFAGAATVAPRRRRARPALVASDYPGDDGDRVDDLFGVA